MLSRAVLKQLSSTERDLICLDSGMEEHQHNSHSDFQELHEAERTVLEGVVGGNVECTQRGTIVLKVRAGGRWAQFTVRDVCYVPDSNTVFSVLGSS